MSLGYSVIIALLPSFLRVHVCVHDGNKPQVIRVRSLVRDASPGKQLTNGGLVMR